MIHVESSVAKAGEAALGAMSKRMPRRLWSTTEGVGGTEVHLHGVKLSTPIHTIGLNARVERRANFRALLHAGAIR